MEGLVVVLLQIAHSLQSSDYATSLSYEVLCKAPTAAAAIKLLLLEQFLLLL